MIKKYVYDNVMIAVSSETKKLLKEIKNTYNYKNMDETVRYLLTVAKVI